MKRDVQHKTDDRRLKIYSRSRNVFNVFKLMVAAARSAATISLVFAKMSVSLGRNRSSRGRGSWLSPIGFIPIREKFSTFFDRSGFK